MARLMLDDDDDNKVDRDALIYQQREEDSKADYANLDKKGKMQFFKDYYLKTVLIALVIIVFVGYNVMDALNKPQTDLYIAIADDVLDADQVAALEDAMETYLGIDGKKHVVKINTDFSSSNYESLQQLQTYLYGGSCDIVIGPEKFFTSLAQGGYFLDPDSSDLVSFYNKLPKEDRLYSMITDGETVRGEKEQDQTQYYFGVSIVDAAKYKALKGGEATAFAGIANSSKHQEEAVACLQFIMNDSLHAGDVDPNFTTQSK